MNHRFSGAYLLSVCVLLVLGSLSNAAAPLADHVLVNAVIYLGWAGADSQAAPYQASDLKRLLDHSHLPDWAARQMAKGWDRLAGTAKDSEQVAAFHRALPLLWRHALAISVSNLSSGADGAPDGNIALICDAGADAGELESDLETAIGSNPHLKLQTADRLVTLGVDRPVDPQPISTLAGNPAFITAMKKLQPSPAVVLYVDGKSLLERLNESAAKDTHGAADDWPKARDAMGIGQIQTMAITGGFEDNRWHTKSLLDAPQPHSGVVAGFDSLPLDPLLMARVPASAEPAAVFNLDLAKLVDAIGATMAVRPESDTFFHQVNGLATITLGANLRRQIIKPLGPQWVLYFDPTTDAPVLMNHPSDPSTASDSMVSVIFGLVNLANAQIPGAATQPVVNAVQSTVKNVDVTSAVSDEASPSVAVKDDILYFALTPDEVVTAATLPNTMIGKKELPASDR